MTHERLLIIAKRYLQEKVYEGIYEQAIFSVLDEDELIALYKITKERDELWKSL